MFIGSVRFSRTRFRFQGSGLVLSVVEGSGSLDTATKSGSTFKVQGTNATNQASKGYGSFWSIQGLGSTGSDSVFLDHSFVITM